MKEIDLVNTLVAYLEKYNIRYSREVRMGIGIPDIVINLGAKKTMTRITDYYILSFAEYVYHQKKIPLDSAAKYFSFDHIRSRNILSHAVEKKIVSVRNGFVYCNKNLFSLNLGKAIAIEVKINDWKGGILQAQRYLSFADYSYLAISDNKVKNINIELLKMKGIGLLSLTENSIHEVLSPRESKVCDYKQKYIMTSSTNLDIPVNRRKEHIFSPLLIAI